MFGHKKQETSWGKVAAAAAAMQLIPLRKTLFRLAAVAGAVYAFKRLRR